MILVLFHDQMLHNSLYICAHMCNTDLNKTEGMKYIWMRSTLEKT